ncbi:hypothetical protein [Nonomuraea dietziae]|uniref:hypothetical protein n=1 Tax=Nonomuraea dietziae TaxID=65515 RepID=UPI0033D7D8A0
MADSSGSNRGTIIAAVIGAVATLAAAGIGILATQRAAGDAAAKAGPAATVTMTVTATATVTANSAVTANSTAPADGTATPPGETGRTAGGGERWRGLYALKDDVSLEFDHESGARTSTDETVGDVHGWFAAESAKIYAHDGVKVATWEEGRAPTAQECAARTASAGAADQDLAAGPKKAAEGICVLSSEGNLAWLELKTVKSELGWPKSVSGSAIVWGR